MEYILGSDSKWRWPSGRTLKIDPGYGVENMRQFNRIVITLLVISLSFMTSYAYGDIKCPIDTASDVDVVNLEDLVRQRVLYEQLLNDEKQQEHSTEIVICYGKILDVEIKMSFLTKQYRGMYEASKKMLGLDPSDAKGVFYLAIAYHYL